MIWFSSPTAIRQDNNSHLLWRPVESKIMIGDFSAHIKWPTSSGNITLCQWLVKYQMFLKLIELKVKVCTSVTFWVFALKWYGWTKPDELCVCPTNYVYVTLLWHRVCFICVENLFLVFFFLRFLMPEVFTKHTVSVHLMDLCCFILDSVSDTHQSSATFLLLRSFLVLTSVASISSFGQVITVEGIWQLAGRRFWSPRSCSTHSFDWLIIATSLWFPFTVAFPGTSSYSQCLDFCLLAVDLLSSDHFPSLYNLTLTPNCTNFLVYVCKVSLCNVGNR